MHLSTLGSNKNTNLVSDFSNISFKAFQNGYLIISLPKKIHNMLCFERKNTLQFIIKHCVVFGDFISKHIKDTGDYMGTET